MTTKRVSYEQLETLWDFLKDHKEIAMGYNKSAQAREMSRRLWTEVTQSLNSIVGGAIKDFKGWAAYWIDYKGKLKRKCAAIRRAQLRTGGGPAETSALSDIEKKYLSILGDDYGLGLPGVQVDPFDVDITMAPDDSPMSESILTMPGTSDAIAMIEVTPVPGTSEVTAIPEVSQDAEVIVQTTMNPELMRPLPPERQTRRPIGTSKESARKALVESARLRAESTEGIHDTLKGILSELSNIRACLQSINNR